MSDYIEALGQPHLALGLDSLSLAQQSAFLETLKRYGPETLNAQRLCLRQPPLTISSFRPLEAVSLSGFVSDQLLGEQCMREGKAACLVLAGGEGTRLGHSAPKGTLPISMTGKSLFQRIAERVIAAGRRAERHLPLAIMTSPANHDQTCAFFDAHALFGLKPSQLSFFRQSCLPLLDKRGNWLLSAPGVLAEGPDGNGTAFKTLYACGLWDKWYKEGVEFINVIFVDNPLADPFDSECIGFTQRGGLDIGMKIVERLSLDEKMGIIVEQGGKIKVIEYTEFSPDQTQSYRYASPGLFCFHMEFVRKLCAEKLPLHLAHKQAVVIPAGETSPKKTTVLKSETFQFDLLDRARKSAALLYPRSRTYAPIKNAAGEKSPQTAREALLAFDQEIYRELSGQPAPDFPFELDTAFYYLPASLKQSMQGRSLPSTGYISLEMFMG